MVNDDKSTSRGAVNMRHCLEKHTAGGRDPSTLIAIPSFETAVAPALQCQQPQLHHGLTDHEICTTQHAHFDDIALPAKLGASYLNRSRYMIEQPLSASKCVGHNLKFGNRCLYWRSRENRFAFVAGRCINRAYIL